MATTTLNTLEVKEQFNDLINRVSHQKEQIIVTRRNKEIAVIIPIEDYALLQENQDKQDLREATESLKEARSAGTLTLDQLKENLDT